MRKPRLKTMPLLLAVLATVVGLRSVDGFWCGVVYSVQCSTCCIRADDSSGGFRIGKLMGCAETTAICDKIKANTEFKDGKYSCSTSWTARRFWLLILPIL